MVEQGESVGLQERPKRPLGVTLFAVFFIFSGFLWLLYGLYPFSGFFVLGSLALVGTAVGLLRGARWAPWAALAIFTPFWLITFIESTLRALRTGHYWDPIISLTIYALIIYYFRQPHVRKYFAPKKRKTAGQETAEPTAVQTQGTPTSPTHP